LASTLVKKVMYCLRWKSSIYRKCRN